MRPKLVQKLMFAIHPRRLGGGDKRRARAGIHHAGPAMHIETVPLRRNAPESGGVSSSRVWPQRIRLTPAGSPAALIVRPVANTAKPASARLAATPLPTPRLAPVTKATGIGGYFLRATRSTG
jgi:hypothetical protein